MLRRPALELKAVFAASENTLSAAIIGQKGQRARLYTVGESVPGNAVSQRSSQQVLLRRDEARVTGLSSQHRPVASPQRPHLQPTFRRKRRPKNHQSAEPLAVWDLPAQPKVAEECTSATQQLLADPEPP